MKEMNLRAGKAEPFRTVRRHSLAADQSILAGAPRQP
jgi:hypothetical protein